MMQAASFGQSPGLSIGPTIYSRIMKFDILLSISFHPDTTGVFVSKKFSSQAALKFDILKTIKVYTIKIDRLTPSPRITRVII